MTQDSVSHINEDMGVPTFNDFPPQRLRDEYTDPQAAEPAPTADTCQRCYEGDEDVAHTCGEVVAAKWELYDCSEGRHFLFRSPHPGTEHGWEYGCTECSVWQCEVTADDAPEFGTMVAAYPDDVFVVDADKVQPRYATTPRERFEDMSRELAGGKSSAWVPVIDAQGITLGLATFGERGYSPMKAEHRIDFGTYADACTVADAKNEAVGMPKEVAQLIAIDSMRRRIVKD